MKFIVNRHDPTFEMRLDVKTRNEMGEENKNGNMDRIDDNSKVKMSIIIFCIPEEMEM
jgi:hypothetical protein